MAPRQPLALHLGRPPVHANHTVTGPGIAGAPIWEALAPNRFRIDWSVDRKVEYLFDYTWGSFNEAGNAATVHHVMK